MDLEVSFRAAVLNDIIGDVFLSNDFLVEQQLVTWSYSGCIIYLGKERRVFVS